jgi:hypothetical protein
MPPIYVTLSEGADSFEARPFVVVDDPDVAHAVARLIARRLGVQAVAGARATPQPVRALPVRRPDEDGDR